MQTDTALIEALERAEGPSRELFAKVGEAMVGADGWDYSRQARFLKFCEAEAWLDAALTLVPEGWCVQSIRQTPEIEKEEHTGVDPLPDWEVALLRQDCAGYRNRRKFQQAFQYGAAATPAIALVIAALRAKGAQS